MYLYSNLFTWQKKSSRGLTWVNLLLYHYMLGLPESKFIYILRFLLDKINKKILWFRLELSNLKRAYQQETFANEKGSSETLRDIAYDFDEYSLLIPQHKNKFQKSFLEWFIGLTEGCGSFIVSKNKVYFDITLNLDDIQVIYYIRKELGFGQVKVKVLIRDGDKPKCSFYVSSSINFLRLIHLFNGNLSSNTKKEEFKEWLNTFNELYNMNVYFKDQLVKISLHSGWLSGFIDGYSTNCFLVAGGGACLLKSDNSTLNSSSNLLGTGYNCKFEVCSAQKDLDVIKSIRDVFFNLNTLEYKNIKKSEEGWIFYCSSSTKLKVIINYFSRYNLKTKKSLLFTKWRKIRLDSLK